MKLDKIHTLCLNLFTNDYERVEDIKMEFEKDYGQSIKREDFIKCIGTLVEWKLLIPYKFDENKQDYIRTVSINFNEDWFLISELGKNALDENWEKDYENSSH